MERGQVQGTYIHRKQLKGKTPLSQYASACSETDAPKLVVRYLTSNFIVDLCGEVRLFLSTLYINSLKLEPSSRRQIFMFSEIKSANETNLECSLGAFSFYSYFLRIRQFH